MGSLLKLIAWVLIIYLVVKFIRNIFSQFTRKGPGDSFDPHRNSRSQEGDTTIKQKPGASTHHNKEDDEGEYIDYKEIKD